GCAHDGVNSPVTTRLAKVSDMVLPRIAVSSKEDLCRSLKAGSFDFRWRAPLPPRLDILLPPKSRSVFLCRRRRARGRSYNALLKNHAAPEPWVPAETNAANHRWPYDNRWRRHDSRCHYNRSSIRL